MNGRLAWYSMLVVGLACLVGCGGGDIQISGTIKKKNEVVKLNHEALLSFRNVDPQVGRSFTAKVDYESSKYTVKLPSGKYKINLYVPGVYKGNFQDKEFDLTETQELNLMIK